MATPSENEGSKVPPFTPSKVPAGGAADDTAQGLMRFLTPLLTETDEQIKAVIDSQNALSTQVDALTEEFKRFSELSKIPQLAPYVQKLGDARNRITNINLLLDKIVHRLDRVHTMASSPE